MSVMPRSSGRLSVRGSTRRHGPVTTLPAGAQVGVASVLHRATTRTAVRPPGGAPRLAASR